MKAIEDMTVHTPEQAPAAPRERYRSERERRLAMLNGWITDTTTQIAADGNALKSYLDIQSRFPAFSVKNTLLILCQQSDMTDPADMETWKARGAVVKKGSEGAMILVRGKQYTKADGSIGYYTDTKTLYDVTQTTKKPAPRPILHYDSRLLLKAVLRTSPCKVEPSGKISEKRRGFYSMEKDTLFIRPGMTPDNLFQTLAEQIAVRLAFAQGVPEPNRNFLGYCAAYMLCKRFGVDTAYFRFDALPGYFEGLDEKRTVEELTHFCEIANQMTASMEKTLELGRMPAAPMRESNGRG